MVPGLSTNPLPCRAGTDPAGLGGSGMGSRTCRPKALIPLHLILIILSGLQVPLQAAAAEGPGPGQCLGLLRLDSVESAQLCVGPEGRPHGYAPASPAPSQHPHSPAMGPSCPPARLSGSHIPWTPPAKT